MDENSPNISPPNSKNISVQHVDNCLSSTPNELKANDLDSTTSSPRRPLCDTTIPSMNISQQKPIPGKDATLNDKRSHSDSTVNHETHRLSTPTTPQPAQKQRHRDQQSLLDIYNDNDSDENGGGDDDDDKEKLRHNSQGLHKPAPTAITNPKASDTMMVAAIGAAIAAAETATASASNSTEVHTNTPEQIVSSEGQVAVDDLKTQVVDLGAALTAEREKGAWISAWEKDMERLVQHFKDIRDDMMESVDILAEFGQVMLAFDHKKQQQAEVDHLMNRVAERLFEVEEARQQQQQQQSVK